MNDQLSFRSLTRLQWASGSVCTSPGVSRSGIMITTAFKLGYGDPMRVSLF